MNVLAVQFRARATELSEAADEVMSAPDFAVDPKKQVTATSGKTVAHILVALADMVEFQQGASRQDVAAERRRQLLERNDAIRRAAARGDWDAFDKLVEGFGEPIGSEGAEGGNSGQ